jgi:DNA-binding NarL/FixJ family response regulator
MPLDLIVYHSRGHGATDLDEISELRKVLTAVKLLVLSDSVTMEPALMQRILAEGTAGIILTSSNSLDMLVSAIRLVSSGGTFVSREFFMTGGPSNRSPVERDVHGVPRLTQRERSVLELIRHGKPNKIIAHELGLSLCTVKVHARNLIRKMGASNRTQAAMNAEKIF